VAEAGKEFSIDPISQFEIQRILGIEIGGVDVSFSNSALFMGVAVLLTLGLMHFGMQRRALVPGRLQSVAEVFYEFVANLVRDHAGPDARPYFPFVFSLFMFVLLGNMLGMIPGSFTFTSHIIVTFAMAFGIFVFVTVLAIVKHGTHFFSFFMPHGAPLWLAPILIPIEVISYLSRPVSLSVRLFANMLAGHMILKVFAYFSIGLVTVLGGAAGWGLAVVPLALNVALIAFEFLVAFLQAYVFTLLTCLYIRDALELH
jgi:F-type H+-transporting ATPase subunit a